MAGIVSLAPEVPTVLGVNTAIDFKAGVPGTLGAANDTILKKVKILKNAGPATLTINSGFRRETNAQDTTHYVLTGSANDDRDFDLNWLNTAGPLNMTASVANMVIVTTQAAQAGNVG